MNLRGKLARLVARCRTFSLFQALPAIGLLVALTLASRAGLEAFIPDGLPVILLMLPVAICAALFGTAAGLVAAVLSLSGAMEYPIALLWDPQTPLRPSGTGMIVFAGVSTAVCMMVGQRAQVLRAMGRRIEQLQREERRRVLQIQEMAHRYRNDLAAAASLLTMRAKNAESQETKDALDDSTRHLRALATIHSTLHHAALTHGADGALVDSREFLSKLGRNLWSALTGYGMRQIPIDVQAEPHILSTEVCVALGLVVHETVTNAMKYAFPGERPGRVGISFSRRGADYILVVSDTGIGPGRAAQLAGQAGTGVGSRVMRATARGLGGEFSREPGPHLVGTVCRLVFPVRQVAAEAVEPDRQKAVGRAWSRLWVRLGGERLALFF